jgi:4-amino-4-deoxy-L-arabinose transferase-like glycosyltransferase
VVVAFFLRLHRIGAEELWLDEAFSFHDVTVAGWLGALRFKDVPPLYPLLLRGWIGLAGDSESALRLLSALFGTLFVGASIWAGREIFEPRIGLWSGVWAAVSPIHIYYSQEARPYALLTALLVVTYVLLWRALRVGTSARWALVSVAVAAVLYTHYLAILALVPTAFMLSVRPTPEHVRRYVAAVVLGAVLFLPWVVWSFVLTRHPLQGVDWIRQAWERTPPLLAIPRSLEILYLGSQKGLLPITLKQFDTLAYPPALRVLGFCSLLLLGLWVAGPWGNGGLALPLAGRRAAMLWGWLFSPLVVLWTISWAKPMYLAGRYDQLASPPFPLLLGLGLGKLQAVRRFGPVLASLAALGLLVPVATKLFLFYRQPPGNREQSRITAETLAQRVADGDLVVFTDFRGYPVIYQLHRLGYRVRAGACQSESSAKRFTFRMFPRELGPLPTQRDVDRVADAPDVIRADLEDYLSVLGTSGHAAYVVLGTYAVSGGAFSVPRDDALLLQQMEQLGFRSVSVDAALGIVAYRRP